MADHIYVYGIVEDTDLSFEATGVAGATDYLCDPMTATEIYTKVFPAPYVGQDPVSPRLRPKRATTDRPLERTTT
ncbi:hypothetical protein ACERIM_08255 [Natrinema sp. H-ect1]|uniref:hypothetical protein n=1 Tax=Natrinema sp. H-ect1 TaxID=3242700 RepID=UPI00359E5C66